MLSTDDRQALLDEPGDLGELAVAAHGRADDLDLLEEQPRAGSSSTFGPDVPPHTTRRPPGRERPDRSLPGGRADALDDHLGPDRPVLDRSRSAAAAPSVERRVPLGARRAR